MRRSVFQGLEVFLLQLDVDFVDALLGGFQLGQGIEKHFARIGENHAEWPVAFSILSTARRANIGFHFPKGARAWTGL